MAKVYPQIPEASQCGFATPITLTLDCCDLPEPFPDRVFSVVQ
jgi:hypothetical protein